MKTWKKKNHKKFAWETKTFFLVMSRERRVSGINFSQLYQSINYNLTLFPRFVKFFFSPRNSPFLLLSIINFIKIWKKISSRVNCPSAVQWQRFRSSNFFLCWLTWKLHRLSLQMSAVNTMTWRLICLEPQRVTHPTSKTETFKNVFLCGRGWKIII